jgi:hypothetical protein
MVRRIVTLISLAVLLIACRGSKPGAKITSVKYAESIRSSGVTYTYTDFDILEIKMDFNFDESLASDLDPTSEDYRDKICDILIDGAHLYYKDEEVKRTFGYWPEEAGKDYAKEMTLFYLVPKGHSVQDLRFVYDGAVLGEGTKSIDTEIKPER